MASRAERCETCRFCGVRWRQGEPYTAFNSNTCESRDLVRSSDAFMCRRHPPTLHQEHGFVWPDVEADDWCGEYQAALTKEDEA